MNKEFWTRIIYEQKINDKVVPSLTLHDSYQQFLIKELPISVHYEISLNDSLSYVALDIEHETLIQIYKKYFNILCEIYPYEIYENARKLSIYKETDINKFIDDMNQMIETTYEKVLQIYKKNAKKDIGDTFDEIYKKNIWGYGSGSGSDAGLLRPWINCLNDFIKEKKIKNIVDCGCGDWQYMKFVNLNEVEYQGYDVSSVVIEQNKKAYEKDNIKFNLYDGNFELLPKCDLLICKEVLQHLPDENVFKFKEILPRFKYALICNSEALDEKQNNSKNIKAGEGRPLAISQAPFNYDVRKIMEIKRGKYSLRFYLYENPKKKYI